MCLLRFLLCLNQFNPVYEVVVSVDKMAMLEYWTGPKHDYAFPKTVDWQFKTDTDLYEFAKVIKLIMMETIVDVIKQVKIETVAKEINLIFLNDRN